MNKYLRKIIKKLIAVQSSFAKHHNIIENYGDQTTLHAMFSNDDKRNPKGAMVFYDIDYLKKKLQDVFEIKSITQEASGKKLTLSLVN